MHGHRFADHPLARGRARGRAPEAAPPVERAEVAGWFAGRLPDDWFTGPVELTIDRDEITVVGRLAEPDAGNADAAAARAGRIARFREETRARRMAVADAAQERYGRSVAWGAVCGDTRELFTNLSMPVMTRLRQRERLRPRPATPASTSVSSTSRSGCRSRVITGTEACVNRCRVVPHAAPQATERP